ncbi:MAG TPA: hypothetical protein VK851_03395 [Anaerolineales bacterium]|nr:hypothetical protein [Anaerolineales bacterium]
MPKIVFRGKTYNSVFEMPDDIRAAYQIEKRTKTAGTNADQPLTDFIEMSDEIKEMYERAVGKVDKKTASSQPLKEFPKSEDIFRQSAPSEESMYRPSKLPTPPSQGAIEEDNGSRRLALTIIGIVILIGAAFFILQNM